MQLRESVRIHPEVARLPTDLAIRLQQPLALHACAFEHGNGSQIAVEYGGLDAYATQCGMGPGDDRAGRPGRQPTSLMGRGQVVGQFSAVVFDVDVVEADGAEQLVVAVEDRPAAASRVARMVDDLPLQSLYRDIAPAGVLDHARQRQVVRPGARVLQEQFAQGVECNAIAPVSAASVGQGKTGNDKGQVVDLAFDRGAGERTRTFMGSPPADFESAAYTIPPHRQQRASVPEPGGCS
uniref:Uncharacterized protein n=1 Tax=Knufia peltigerae TaxID=1002370 RepID=A0AA38Y256_9EURO|nr:hypothetical protein H2204_007336 [Knufia peltigerae]